MPRNVTPLSFVVWNVFSRSAASARHGAHHEPQKLTTRTWPLAEATSYAPPSSRSPLTSLIAVRLPGAHSTTPSLLVVHFLTQSVPPLQPASTPVARAAASSTAARRRIRI